MSWSPGHRLFLTWGSWELLAISDTGSVLCDGRISNCVHSNTCTTRHPEEKTLAPRRGVSLWLLFSIDIDWRNLHCTETTWVLLEVGARMQRRWCNRRPCFVSRIWDYENFFNETSHMRQEGVSIETSTWISKHACHVTRWISTYPRSSCLRVREGSKDSLNNSTSGTWSELNSNCERQKIGINMHATKNFPVYWVGDWKRVYVTTMESTNLATPVTCSCHHCWLGSLDREWKNNWQDINVSWTSVSVTRPEVPMLDETVCHLTRVWGRGICPSRRRLDRWSQLKNWNQTCINIQLGAMHTCAPMLSKSWSTAITTEHAPSLIAQSCKKKNKEIQNMFKNYFLTWIAVESSNPLETWNNIF